MDPLVAVTVVVDVVPRVPVVALTMPEPHHAYPTATVWLGGVALMEKSEVVPVPVSVETTNPLLVFKQTVPEVGPVVDGPKTTKTEQLAPTSS